MPLQHDNYNLMLADPVARYMDKSGRKPDCTPEEILDLAANHGQLVSWYFTSLAYLNEKDFYRSWDEVPEPFEGMYAYIRTTGMVKGHKFIKGKWMETGELYDDMYK